MVKMVVFLLMILTKEVVNGESAGGTARDLLVLHIWDMLTLQGIHPRQQPRAQAIAFMHTYCFPVTPILNPRCTDGIRDVEYFKKTWTKLIVERSMYEQSGKVVCVEDDDKKELPELVETDDWNRWISLIGNLTTANNGYVCQQFPNDYTTAYKALKNREIRRNCSLVAEFCDNCETGCRRVHPIAYSSRETMIEWAVDTIGLKDSACQQTWISSNILQGLKVNSTWLLEIREACEVCYGTECNTVRGKFVSNLLLAQLEKRHSDPMSVWNHICKYPTALGIFGYEAFNLEQRYNRYDEHMQLILAFQSNSWWSMPLIVLCIIGFTAFFTVPNKYREFFNLDAFVASYNKFKNDRFLQWLIQRIATKALRMKTKAAKTFKRIIQKRSKAAKNKTSVVSKEPKTKESAISDQKKKLSNGKGTSGRGSASGRRN